jgi:hypothetical protein
VVSPGTSSGDSIGSWKRTGITSRRRGVSSSRPSTDPRAKEVAVTDDELSVLLADGRRLTVPLAWFPRLLRATPSQRAHFELIGDGQGIHWPELDEDLSVAGLLKGTPSASR